MRKYKQNACTYLWVLFQVEGYWDECLVLPSKLKDWDAYNDLKIRLQTYLKVFPLLRKLSSKVNIFVYIEWQMMVTPDPPLAKGLTPLSFI